MARRQERGLSLVELLVGAAVGLIVVAAAGSVVAAHQASGAARAARGPADAGPARRRRARRRATCAGPATGQRPHRACAAATSRSLVNPHAEIAAASGAAAVVALSFSTGAGDAASVDDGERFGFRLRNGAIEMQLGARNWQALSDPGTVVVTSFSVVPRVDEADLADVLRQAVQRRQHDLPAAPADPQLRDQRRRPLGDRCAR